MKVSSARLQETREFLFSTTSWRVFSIERKAVTVIEIARTSLVDYGNADMRVRDESGMLRP